MPSKIEICNIALSKIGKHPIASFEEGSKEAKECRLLYDRSLESVLRDHQWNFATKRIVLAELAEEVIGFDYVYAYPTDCLLAIRIYDLSGAEQDIEFEIGITEDLSARVILTNEINAVLVYTAKVENPNVFDSLFVDALAARIAMDVSVPLKGDPRVQAAMMQTYNMLLGRAQRTNSNERVKEVDNDSAFSEAR